MGGQFLCIGADSVAVLETGTDANVGRSRRLGHRNEISGNKEIWRVTTYPACVRFKFGDGHLSEVRYAA